MHMLVALIYTRVEGSARLTAVHEPHERQDWPVLCLGFSALRKLVAPQPVPKTTTFCLLLLLLQGICIWCQGDCSSDQCACTDESILLTNQLAKYRLRSIMD